MSTSPGRNDPCPCGSGQKFKKCCGGVAAALPFDPEVARANALKAVDIQLHDVLLKFAAKRGGQSWITHALDEFFVDVPKSEIEVELQLAVPWVLYHYPTFDTGDSMAGALLDERGPKLTSAMRSLLAAQLQTHLSLWSVTDIERGTGLWLTDLLTGHQEFAYEISASQSVEKHAVLLGRIVADNDVAFIAGLHSITLPPLKAEQVITAFRKHCRTRARKIPVEWLRDPDLQIDLLRIWRMFVAAAYAPPTLTNTDGDPLSFVSDRFDFDTRNRAAVLAALHTLRGAEPGTDDGAIAEVLVVRPGTQKSSPLQTTIIGRIEVHASRLKVETNSVKRADTLRASIEQTLSTLARYRIREETTSTAALDPEITPRTERSASADDDTTPEMHEMMRQLREQHMLNWLDDSIPALKGLTPRQAAANKRHHSALDTLLRDLEYHENQLPAEQRIDLRKLRLELGR
jgi:hypothetical protein